MCETFRGVESFCGVVDNQPKQIQLRNTVQDPCCFSTSKGHPDLFNAGDQIVLRQAAPARLDGRSLGVARFSGLQGFGRLAGFLLVLLCQQTSVCLVVGLGWVHVWFRVVLG